MTSRAFHRVQALFESLVEQPPERRRELLERECADDPELRRSVEALLESDDQGESFLSQPILRPIIGTLDELRSSSALRGGEANGSRIGGYELLGKIGQGGMSTVYLAQSSGPATGHEVAIKVIRPDHHQEGARERFGSEQRILASLDHPYVARLLDSGIAGDGSPFFVMEYVEGEPITEYCDLQRLSVRSRLELFRKVCAAVQYAHQNLIVHRDIKPSNILIDAAGDPRLLDFGIAKLLEVTADSDNTRSGIRALTPSYAAPELFAGGAVTTATDVYSLGVLLYELLTGTRPFDWSRLSPSAILEEWERRDPPLPSSVAPGGEGGNPMEAAARRNTSPAALLRALRGDLDNISLRSLRFEPEQRYASVQELSEDIARHLSGLPVVARPSTRRYRLAKFLRRHRVAALNGVLVGLLVIGFSTVSTVQSFRLTRQRAIAERQRDLAERERLESERQRRRAEAVTRFLVDSYELADPYSGQGGDITLRELLTFGSRRAEQALGETPDVQATVQQTLGRIYVRLGLYDEARTLLEEALALRRDLHGGDHEEIAETLSELATLFEEQGDLEAAEGKARESLEMRQRLGNPRSVAIGVSLRQLGSVLARRGSFEEGEADVRAALDLHRQLLGAESSEVALDLAALLEVELRRGDPAAAEKTGVAALAAVRRVFPKGSVVVADGAGNLGLALAQLRRFDEAEALELEALESHRSRLGPRHPTVAAALNNLGMLRFEAGDLEGAESSLRQALDIFRSRHGEEHPDAARALSNLGRILMAGNRLEEAEAAFRDSLETQRRLMGDEHPLVAEALMLLGSTLFVEGELEESAVVLRRSLEIRRASLGEDSTSTGESRLVLGRVLVRKGAVSEAAEQFAAALESFRRLDGGNRDWLVAIAAMRLAEARLAQDRSAEAMDLVQESLALFEVIDPESAKTAEARGVLGRVLSQEGRYEEAERELLSSLRGIEEAPARSAEQQRIALERLVAFYQRWDRPQAANDYRRRLARFTGGQ